MLHLFSWFHQAVTSYVSERDCLGCEPHYLCISSLIFPTFSNIIGYIFVIIVSYTIPVEPICIRSSRHVLGSTFKMSVFKLTVPKEEDPTRVA